jgi:hypothetical protein|tara:strand:- start:4407 stop:4985 length:579 start_codon:yes stop_codon:yes gene_type:complete
MEVKTAIKIYDDVLHLPTLGTFLKVINSLNFKQAGLVGNSDTPLVVNEKIRKVFDHTIRLNGESRTETHWWNLLYKIFTDHIFKYCKELNLNPHHTVRRIEEITVLKYEDTGHYKWHSDHDCIAPRTLSLIYLLNNDYEGGELMFKNITTNEIMKIETKPNRIIIWPSNFLYPHKVDAVTKGIRYSVVCWGL